jgi:hypothetical protein
MTATTNRRRPRVLLGITGSVAAIKGPEIAVRLVKELNVDVCVLLTHGGYNFWTKANEYNPAFWTELKSLAHTSGTFDIDAKEEENEETGKLYIHCK